MNTIALRLSDSEEAEIQLKQVLSTLQVSGCDDCNEAFGTYDTNKLHHQAKTKQLNSENLDTDKAMCCTKHGCDLFSKSVNCSCVNQEGILEIENILSETELSKTAAKHSDTKSVCEKCGTYKKMNPPHVCMIGLHSCGDLIPVMLRLYTKLHAIRSLVVVGCCYHRMQFSGIIRFSIFSL